MWPDNALCPAQRARPHDAVVVASYDVNPLANDTYALNFGRRPSGRDIRSLKPDDLDAHAADLWLLSPPCQARLPVVERRATQLMTRFARSAAVHAQRSAQGR